MKAAVQWLEYALFTTWKWKLRFLPEGMSLWWGSVFGWLAGRVLGLRWHVGQGNLMLAVPERSREWRDQVGDASYRHIGREFTAMLRLSWMSADEVVARTSIEGFEAFQEALSEGKGVVLATGHVGSWEAGAACLAARGVPMVAVTKGMSNKRFGEALTEIRRNLGYRSIDPADAPRQVLAALADGSVVALLGDQNIRRGGVFVPFFGKPAATPRGAAVFALRTGAPLFLGAAILEPGRPHRYRGILERIPVEATGDTEEDIRRITAAHTAALERIVRAHPDQYFWQHKRWDTQPALPSGPELPPGASV